MNSTSVNDDQKLHFKPTYSLQILPYLVLNILGIIIGTLGRKRFSDKILLCLYFLNIFLNL